MEKEEKQLVINFDVKIIIRFILYFVFTYIIVLLLQFTKDVYCGAIMPDEILQFRGGREFVYDAGSVPGYTTDFKTFFGNKLKSDYNKSNQYREVYKDEAESLKKSGHFVFEIPGSYKFIVYNSKMSQMDCLSPSHKFIIRVKGAFKDYIPTILFSVFFTIIHTLFLKLKTRIKVNFSFKDNSES